MLELNAMMAGLHLFTMALPCSAERIRLWMNISEKEWMVLRPDNLLQRVSILQGNAYCALALHECVPFGTSVLVLLSLLQRVALP